MAIKSYIEKLSKSRIYLQNFTYIAPFWQNVDKNRNMSLYIGGCECLHVEPQGRSGVVLGMEHMANGCKECVATSQNNLTPTCLGGSDGSLCCQDLDLHACSFF